MIIQGKDIRLPKRFKDRWIKALRSGKYIQGRNKLLRKELYNNTYCCLGVAGAICGINEEVLVENSMLHDKFMKDVPKILSSNNNLTTDSDGNDLAEKLAQMNDSGKWSFNRIASYIEKYL